VLRARSVACDVGLPAAVSLTVAEGDRVAVVGPNGVGKTTLIDALCGDVPLARGERRIGFSVRIGRLAQRRAGALGDDPVATLRGHASHDRAFCAAARFTRTIDVRDGAIRP
jgi:ATPase subunit of ABC transporter with duplicated ATPase domains